MFNGIDVSKHNAYNALNEISKADFVIIRAGYGKYDSQFDPKCLDYIEHCVKCDKPYALYWYSYAKTKNDVLLECRTISSILDARNITTKTIFYDMEESYQLGKLNDFINEFTKYFHKLGYKTGLYANTNFFSAEKQPVVNCDYIWLAHWTKAQNPKYDFWDVWQYNSDNIDKNYAKTLEPFIKKNLNTDYLKIARDIMDGKYGNGNDRVVNLKKNGINYDIVQPIVNLYLKIANDIIKGIYGNGNERKNKLSDMDIDYETAQYFVNKILKGG